MITKFSDLEPKNVDWKKVGKRVKRLRESQQQTIEEFARDCEMTQGSVEFLEQGQKRKTVNALWQIRSGYGVSFNWLLNGRGKPFDPDPPRLVPETILEKKGAGIRHEKHTKETENGSYSGDEMEFVLAIDAYRRINDMQFPRWTEVHRLLIGLGYRKIAQPTIRPQSPQKLGAKCPKK